MCNAASVYVAVDEFMPVIGCLLYQSPNPAVTIAVSNKCDGYTCTLHAAALALALYEVDTFRPGLVTPTRKETKGR